MLSVILQGASSVDPGRSEVTITENEAILLVRKAERNDEGSYNVTLTNSKGQAMASVRVNVRGAHNISVFILFPLKKLRAC